MCDMKYDSDRVSLWLRGCVSLLVYACVSMRIITERRQTRRRKMNMLYGGSKILHGPSAREEPRAECLRLPNIINYLCCVWPIRSLGCAAGAGVAALLMNTNYTFVSLLLSASWRLSLCRGRCFGMSARLRALQSERSARWKTNPSGWWTRHRRRKSLSIPKNYWRSNNPMGFFHWCV